MQSISLMHTSNLYYIESQGELAEKLVALFGGNGKMFFCNSGAEANEGLFKLARRVGMAKADGGGASGTGVSETGRFEIITATNSFHGRTLAAIAATFARNLLCLC